MRNARSETNIIKKILKDEYGMDVMDPKCSLTEADINKSWKSWIDNAENVFVLCGLPKDVYCHIIAEKVATDFRGKS